ncbi:MAG: elongation factor G [Clostridia bacterium]|nr:elongation factor G [Clostridia bacterium]MBR0537153.1 elongation factor G [Clostridia bacterium]
MKQYSADNIRNVVIAGHGGRGKTTLAEAMLYVAGASDRLGRVADGNTVMDFDAEEKRRHNSVSSAVCPIEWNDTKVNIIDTPGLFDFATGMAEGIRAAESVLIVLAAGSGVDVGAEKAYKAAKARNMAKYIIVTRCDAEHADFYKTVDALKEEYGTAVCPVVVPYMQGGKVACYVNFLQNKAFAYANGKASEVAMPDDPQIQEIHEAFTESVASADEELMMKFFDGEEFTHDEIVSALSVGVADGTVMPVYACSGFNNEAVDLVLNGITKLAPAPSKRTETALDANDQEVTLECSENGPLAAICFKTVADPFVGKMSYVKVISGKITPDTPCYCANTGSSQRMGKMLIPKGGKTEDTTVITAGDIGVITKLDDFKTGDTLCSEKNVLKLAGPVFPDACLQMAVKVRKKGEEEKVAQGLRRLSQEDPAVIFYTNDETREQILAGLGEQHLDLIVAKLKSKFGVEVDLEIPRVAYRETIKKRVEIHGRHKKQSGGHGQFGDVWIRFEPCEENELVFGEEVVGGSVPKNFFPAVEKGLRDCVTRGIVAGYPVVGLKATLYDGSYHPVDSSEMAFKTAASLAFKQLKDTANPAILEPIGTLKAYMPDDNLGDIMGDITKRRGRVLGMGPADEPKMQLLEAEVPMAEMGDFSTTLRSVTAGRGYFSLEFARYEEAPANVAQKVIEESHMTDEDED